MKILLLISVQLDTNKAKHYSMGLIHQSRFHSSEKVHSCVSSQQHPTLVSTMKLDLFGLATKFCTQHVYVKITCTAIHMYTNHCVWKTHKHQNQRK